MLSGFDGKSWSLRVLVATLLLLLTSCAPMIEAVMGHDTKTQIAPPPIVKDIKVDTSRYPYSLTKAVVLSFATKTGIPAEEGVALADRFEAELLKLNVHNFEKRATSRRALKETSMPDVFSDVSQAQDAGLFLNVAYVFFGEISRTGEKYHVAVSVMDVQQKRIEATVDLKDIVTDLYTNIGDVREEGLPRLAKKLIGKVIQKNTKSL